MWSSRAAGHVRRRNVTTLAISLFLSGVTAVVSPGVAAAAGGPSVQLPTIPSVPVTDQWMANRPPDPASFRALRGDQGPSTGTPDGQGSSKVTSLSPSATWSVAQQTGDFSWSYPLRVPPAPGGLEPDLSLSYSSAVVDGHTSATNNQASWVGDGWSLSPGFIERSYDTCAADTEDGTTPPKDSGDLCWRSDNATASFAGGAGALIRDTTSGEWRLKSDNGSRVERIADDAAATPDPYRDNNGEYWKITSTDGTQYFFGSRPESKSAWTAPVFGDDVNEPCHGTTFDTSSCTQAWRWNLDKVVDRHGNAIVYYYDTETNSYGFNRKDAAVSYIRGGTLRRAEYGLRDGTSDLATGMVQFFTADRCVPGSACAPDKKDNWPDVAWDDNCDAATCPDHHSPTFWSTKRLEHITTQVRRGTPYTDVDTWTLDHQFPDPGDGEKAALWLKSIKHTGLVGGSIDLPPVVFEGTPMANRVVRSDAIGPLNRYRITGVVSESGGVTTVNYAPPDCSASSIPESPETNTKRCFPARWTPHFSSTERTDYFHKYVVDTVVTSDRLMTNSADPDHPVANPEQLVRYEYLDGAAWHYNQSEFIKDDKKTWDEFRGYWRVRVHTGKQFDPSGPITMTEERFYRGMDGDHLPSGTRPATVTDSENGTRTDSEWLQGFQLESQTHNGETEQIVNKSINTPTWRGPTATRGQYNAYFVATGTAKTYTALESGGQRVTQSDTTYDDYAQVSQVNDLGDLAVTTDDTCTTITYARNIDKWLVSFPGRTEAVSVDCATTPAFPQNALADTTASYDGQALELSPTVGDVTRRDVLSERPASQPVRVLSGTATYDAYGRPLTAGDALGRTTRQSYEPAGGGPETKTVVTNELGHTVTTLTEPAWGVPLKSTDANNFVTENAYDALGRAVETWRPNRPRNVNSNRGNYRISYQIRNDGPTVVTKTSIGPNGNYISVNTLYDPLYRVRQVQAPTEGGRLLTDTRYDSQGRVYKVTQPYVNDAPVDATLWVASDTEIPGLTFTEFDGVGRPVNSIFKAGANEKWRATTAYGGDRVHVTPPQGGTPTTTITNAQGKTTELWQYKGTTPTGDHDTTKYTYTSAGQRESMTDPAGNTWSWIYDLRSRPIRTVDVDKGTLVSTYDDADQVTSATDARGVTLAFDYDRLGRKKTVREGGPTGPVRQEFTYDTATFGKGRPATATRYVDGNPYTQQVNAYGTLGLPTRTSVVIPQSEGVLRGTYTSFFGYNWDGSVKSETYPKAGPTDTEDLFFEYDDFGHTTKARTAFDRTVNLVTATSYTRYGELQQVQLGDAGKRVWMSAYYDTNTRRLNRSIVDAEVPAPMQSDVNYTRDPTGNITSVADARPGSEDRQCFQYDYLHRLTEAWTPSADCSTPSLAGLSGPAPYWQSFTYDSTGNRRTDTQHASMGNTLRTYAYPPTGHKVQSVQTQGPAAWRLDEFGYDAAGNTTQRKVASGNQTLDWDIEGRLGKVTEAGKATSFIYDANGSRLLRKDPTGVTLYLGAQEVRLDSASGSVKTTRYYSVSGIGTVAMRTADGLIWLTGDHQGTAQIAINAQTMAVTQRRQTPFGAPRGQGVQFPGEKGFVGGTIDPSIGLTTLGARQYDTATGRFISVDPILNPGDPQSLNAYAYANNSPITFSDPTGLACSGPDGVGCKIDHQVQSLCGGPACDSAKGVASAPCKGCVLTQDKYGQKYLNNIKIPAGGPSFEKWDAALHIVAENSDIGRWVNADNGELLDPNETINLAQNTCEYLIRQNAGCSSDYEQQLVSQQWEYFMWGNDTGGSMAMAALGGKFRISGKGSKAIEARQCSFLPGTQVLMADGTYKPIDQLQAGDMVLSTDPETGRTEPETVLAPLSSEGVKTMVEITIDTDGATGDQTGKLIATDNHPFWSSDLHTWVPADQLKAGSLLQTSAGTKVQVTAIRTWTAIQTVHNLSVDAFHTYYVVSGSVTILVHNTGCGFDPDFPTIKLDNYRGRFNAWLNKNGLQRLPDDWDAHHAIPQEYRGDPQFAGFDFDAPSNMRGVPGSRMNSRGANVHQEITNQWKWFRDLNPNPTRAQVEDFAAQIDRGYGAYYWTESK
jgi:RHS repeat-associated protein